jgi:pantetheine-phosphate adenylyltransferase
MKRVGVYAGSFDPPTNGHLDVVHRVAPSFDVLYLVVADNARKNTLFTGAERASLLSQALKKQKLPCRVEVAVHHGLTIEFCKKVKCKVMIRGLRAISDFEAEFSMATMNRRLAPDIETFLVMTGENHFFVSSSLVKEAALHGADVRNLVPSNVAKALEKKCRSFKKESRKA